MYNEFEDTPAYAKLQGPNLMKLVTKLNVYLGREVSIVDHAADEDVIFISDSNKISRRHLHIFWNDVKLGWFVKNLSKNPVYVNKTMLSSKDDALKLNPISAIQVDQCKFYFFQSREEEK